MVLGGRLAVAPAPIGLRGGFGVRGGRNAKTAVEIAILHEMAEQEARLRQLMSECSITLVDGPRIPVTLVCGRPACPSPNTPAVHQEMTPAAAKKRRGDAIERTPGPTVLIPPVVPPSVAHSALSPSSPLSISSPSSPMSISSPSSSSPCSPCSPPSFSASSFDFGCLPSTAANVGFHVNDLGFPPADENEIAACRIPGSALTMDQWWDEVALETQQAILKCLSHSVEACMVTFHLTRNQCSWLSAYVAAQEKEMENWWASVVNQQVIMQCLVQSKGCIKPCMHFFDLTSSQCVWVKQLMAKNEKVARENVEKMRQEHEQQQQASWVDGVFADKEDLEYTYRELSTSYCSETPDDDLDGLNESPFFNSFSGSDVELDCNPTLADFDGNNSSSILSSYDPSQVEEGNGGSKAPYQHISSSMSMPEFSTQTKKESPMQDDHQDGESVMQPSPLQLALQQQVLLQSYPTLCSPIYRNDFSTSTNSITTPLPYHYLTPNDNVVAKETTSAKNRRDGHKKARPNFSKDQYEDLRWWMVSKIPHEIKASPEEKQVLCTLSGLSGTQVMAWIANFRQRRYLPRKELLDSLAKQRDSGLDLRVKEKLEEDMYRALFLFKKADQ